MLYNFTNIKYPFYKWWEHIKEHIDDDDYTYF